MTMTKKQKQDAAALSMDEVGALVGKFTQASIALDALTAEMNAELDEIRKRYAARTERLATTAGEAQELVAAWAAGNKARFEKDRSIDFARGIVGFRLGNFKVTTPKGITQADAAQMLAALPWGKPFIRETVELNKEALIAARTELTAAQCAKAGVSIVQEEHFFLSPKQDEPAAVPV